MMRYNTRIDNRGDDTDDTTTENDDDDEPDDVTDTDLHLTSYAS